MSSGEMLANEPHLGLSGRHEHRGAADLHATQHRQGFIRFRWRKQLLLRPNRNQWSDLENSSLSRRGRLATELEVLHEKAMRPSFKRLPLIQAAGFFVTHSLE